jgi:hypothetical protein
MARGPARVHAPPPGVLAQAHQTLCRGFGFGAAGRRARAVFKIRDARDQRLLPKEPCEHTGSVIQFQIRQGISDVAGMPERNDPAGHRMADFVNTRTDGRFNMFATMCIGKSFPITPSLNHENPSESHSKNALQERDN